MINKKAQGNVLIVDIPTLLIVAVIMILFIIVSSSVAVLNRPDLPKESFAEPFENSFLLESFEIDFNGGKKEVLVFDSLILAMQADVEYKRIDAKINAGQYASEQELQSLIKEKDARANALINFKNQLAVLLKQKYGAEKNHCTLIFQGSGNAVQENINVGKSGKDLFIKISEGKEEFVNNEILFEKYWQEKLLVELPPVSVIFSDGATAIYEFKYYNGECKYG